MSVCSFFVVFRCVANHMQMWLEKKMVISHFGYWHFLSTANTGDPNIFVKLLKIPILGAQLT